MKRTLFFLALGTATALATEVSVTLPPETSAYKPGKGAELLQANCLLCHSADYIPTQPRMARKFWEAEIKKMREKYHAPIAEESVPGILEYLVANYGTEAK